MTVSTEPHDVDSQMLFIKRDSKINRRYITPGQEVNTGKYEVHKVHIRDARPRRAECSLETTGFVLTDHKSAVTDFTNQEQIKEIYYPEIEKFVKELTGADKVVVYGDIVRQTKPKEGGREQPPAGDVHVDLATAHAAEVARNLLPPDSKDFKYSRFIHLSNWRSFSPGPQDWPLGVVDSRTVPDEDGIINMAVWQNEPPPEDLDNLPPVPEGVKTGESFCFPYNAGYGWNYFSCMTRDEVLSFKLHDSDHSGTWRTPHCSFANDAEGCKTRESIEIRTCCYFK